MKHLSVLQQNQRRAGGRQMAPAHGPAQMREAHAQSRGRAGDSKPGRGDYASTPGSPGARASKYLCSAPAGAAGVSGTGATEFKTIGTLPATEAGWSDITDHYVKAFGVPPVGQRVFIRTRQLLNGWEDYFKETCADVPPQRSEPVKEVNQLDAGYTGVTPERLPGCKQVAGMLQACWKLV